MKRLLLGLLLTALLPITAIAADDGERTYTCWKLFETKTGGVMALRTSIEGHDSVEAIALCEVAFDPEAIEPLLREKQSRLRSEDGATILRRTVYLPKFETAPTALARTNSD